MTPETEALCKRLETVESDSIGAGLSNNRYRNPDGPEAAAKLREMAGEIERLREALIPSGDTKGAYHGEFTFEIPDCDEDGEECQRRVYVPWTTTKEIMAAISARAAPGGSHG